MKAIISAWKTLTDTLSVVTQYRSYRLYPLLSFIIMLLATFTIMIPLLNRGLLIAHNDGSTWIFLSFVIYFLYGALYFVTTFFNVALLNSIAKRLDAGNSPFSHGISAAFRRIGPIAFYTLVSATLGWVSLLAKVLINPFFGGVIAPFIGNRLWVRWRQLSYSIPLLIAVPIIALEHPIPQHIFKRGGLLVKETWGERVKPAHSIGLLALFVLPIAILFALPALQQGAAGHNADLIWLGSSILLVSMLIFTQLSALVNAILALAAYRYATAHKNDVFPADTSYAEQAFVKSEKEPDEDAALTASISGSPSTISDDPSN